MPATLLLCMELDGDAVAAALQTLDVVHLIQNAGGIPTDDALRSLRTSTRSDARVVVVVQHLGCVGLASTDLAAVQASVRDAVDRVERHLDPSIRVLGCVLESEDPLRLRPS